MFHRHIWKVIDKTTRKSDYQLFLESGGDSLRGASPSFFKERITVTYKCEGCGTEKVERI